MAGAASSAQPSAKAACSREVATRGPALPLLARRGSRGNAFVRDASAKVGPSVVRLDTHNFDERDDDAAKPSDTGSRPGGEQRTLRHFFAPDEALFLGMPQARPRYRQGQGSGVVLDEQQGLILTNAHVVQGAERVRVTFTGGRTATGVVAGVDHMTDLALIRLTQSVADGLPLRAATLGDSADLRIGDWVIAVGNPFGLDNTVTLGIISNLHRTSAEVGIPDKRLDFMQTDCAINPGNSGGPLVNEWGEVVGINTAIHADGEGIGFAIPINTAKRVARQLAEGSKARHAFIGIQMANTNSEAARRFQLERPRSAPLPSGVLVLGVGPGSPAASGGLCVGDVVTRAGRRGVRCTADLQAQVEDSEVGAELRLRVTRGGKTVSVTVVVGDFADVS